MSTSQWFFCRKERPNPQLRLYCFHHAGGGAAVFYPWPDLLPLWVEVHAVRLPGRESRTSEGLRTHFDEISADLVTALDTESTPFAFYGHSMGAAIAYQLVQELYRRGSSLPSYFIVAARRAPHLSARWPSLHTLPDRPFVERLQERYGKFPGHVSPEVLAHFLPIIRADMALLETIDATHNEVVLDCPVLALGGTRDVSVTREELDAWREHTRSDSVQVSMIDGDHLFPVNERASMLQELSAYLRNNPPVRPDGCRGLQALRGRG